MDTGRSHNFGKKQFKINAIGDEVRNRQMRLFDVVTDLAGKSPLTQTRISKKTGLEKTEPYFGSSIGRLRDEVFAEPTDLFSGKLSTLEKLVEAGIYTPWELRAALQNFGGASSAEMKKYRYGAGLNIHHEGPVAASTRAFNHLPIEIQGRHVAALADRASTGSTHLTQDFRAYIAGPEHNAAHFVPVTGKAFKGDVNRNLGNTEEMIGDELIDHFMAVSGTPNRQLAEHVDEFAKDTRERYAYYLNELGIKAKAAELGSPIVRPGDRVSASQRIYNDTKDKIGTAEMLALTAKVNSEAYRNGLQTIIPQASPVTFSSPAEVGKRLGPDERLAVEGMRRRANNANTEGIRLHPGSREDLDAAINLRKLIDVFGVKE